ncbi:TonB-dependent siderophore receptor [Duganella sp. OV510]|nr:TonB-dependent siderophore receptor [Duganella sp. OV510]SDH62799.1 outer-membrane receptor for ferric coprogen and ferric-rhodotorulic acid [Duganella sp. OV458]SDJ41597.1 outer-membrane receptor for ferric coprogen and ferric-rhodotorulic acid [Duganella sp. OV510]
MNKQLKMKHLAVLVSLALPLLAQADKGADDQGTAVLPTVQVSTQKMGDTTEGSGSYTTGRSRTATPLDISLRDTPQSVSVMTQQRIEDQGLTTVTDVVNNVIGISVNQYETDRAGFTARGFDITNLMIDGIPTTWQQSWSSGEVAATLAIYDRVEVVRGATGLTTGAGNPSAAINLVHKRATSKEFTGSVDVGVGRWNERRAQVDVSTPLNQDGSVRARVVGDYLKRDSWVNLGGQDARTVFATVEADLTPKTLLAVGFSRQENDPDGPMWGGLPFWYTDGSKTNWDVSKTTSAAWTGWETSYNNAYLNLEHTFDSGWKARAYASHGDRRGDSHLLYLSGVPDRVTGVGMSAFAGSYVTTTKQDDVNLQLSGGFSLFERKHDASIGLMHSKQKFNSNSRAADFGSAGSDVGNFNNWNGNTYNTPTWGPETFYEASETRQDALYGMVRFSISDPLKVIVGARVTNFEQKGYGLWTPAYSVKNDHEITPYAGVVYDLNDTYSLYGSYTSIFLPQNYKDQAGNTLDPIKGKAAETGIKAEFLDGRVNASLAIFKIKQDNLAQAAGLVDRDGAGPLLPEAYYNGVDGATSRGVEFEVNGELARGWNGSFGYSQFRAKDATGTDFNSIYPRRLLRVFTTYQFAGELSNLTVGGGVNWEGRTYTADPAAPAAAVAANGGLIEQDSFALVNLMARYDISKNLSAQLNINNATDKKHFGMFAAYGAITYAAPRTTALTLKYKF